MENITNKAIYWTQLTLEKWELYIAATTEGLCYVGSPNQNFEEMVHRLSIRFSGNTLIQDDEQLRPYMTELTEYLQGIRNHFTFSFDVQGTPFQQAVWNTLSSIPYGETTSYSAIAHHIQKPAAVRAVGAAIGANPIMIAIPCHRVIGKNGALTGYRGGIAMKTKLLQLEQSSILAKESRFHVN